MDVPIRGLSKFPESHLTLPSLSPSAPGIHSLPGIQHPITTPLNPYTHFFLPNVPSNILQHYPFISGIAPPKFGIPTNPLDRITRPASTSLLSQLPVPISFYLDFSPNSREKVSTKRKRRPIVTDTHDKTRPIRYPTHYSSIRRPSQPHANPCQYINCKDLAFYCPAQLRNSRRSRPENRRVGF